LTTDPDIRARLHRTWFPFFSRFGQLTEVQLRTIPEVLAGRNPVVISPSASGKTEAVTAPAIERLLPDRAGKFSILYVSPTRALVNDLFRRLSEPVAYLGLELARKTGDHPAIDESRLPFMLITTPESFDSLLCRHTAIFKDVRSVVLDELHLLDNTVRGEQLRALLERLRLLNSEVQYCAMSATIDDRDIGRRYFPDPVVVEVPSRRKIEQELLGMGEDWPEQVVATLGRRDCRKVLCFFNARSSAEAAADRFRIPPFGSRVWVHHASLNRKLREETEQTMMREPVGLLCCTSTLELGIDIGDVDAVVLVRPPFNVSSLLQRIGRGNRRTQAELVAIGLYTSPWERFLFETFLDCARAGRLCDKPYTPALSVIPQQILSYLFQRRRIGATREAVKKALAGVEARPGAIDLVFDSLVQQGALVQQRSEVYFLGPKVEAPVEYGKIHSNIQEKSFGQYEVYEQASGRHVGTVYFLFKLFVLAGRAWEMVEYREKEKRVIVKPVTDVGAVTKVFEGTGTGGYGYLMARILKSRLFPELGEDELPFFREAGRAYIVHLLGSTYGFILSEALTRQGIEAADLDGKLLVIADKQEGLSGGFPIPEAGAVRQVVGANLIRFEDSLGSGAFFRMLPKELQIEDHMLALDIAGLFKHLEKVRMVELPQESIVQRLQGHLGTESDEAAKV